MGVILTCDDCGHTTPPNSSAMAAHALARHSCATVRERAARAQRRLDKLALSGPEQPCTHKTHHPHGNRVRYVIDKCRCRPCRDVVRVYEQARNKALAYGKVAYVPAGPARAHVQSLQAQGMGSKRIAEAAGISNSVMWKLLYGDSSRPMAPSKRIRPATETAILAVTLNLGATISVPGLGTRRRLQGLVANGWSQSKLAHQLGMSPANFGKVIHATSSTNVYVATREAVARLYDQLWNTAPPQAGHRDKIAYTRASHYARDAGWVVPLAWDEDNIDNPRARGRGDQHRHTAHEGFTPRKAIAS